MPPTICKVLIQDSETGNVLCILDGDYLSAFRTGTTSGVAKKLLARNDDNQASGIFGAGVQAKMQLWVVSEVRKLAKALA